MITGLPSSPKIEKKPKSCGSFRHLYNWEGELFNSWKRRRRGRCRRRKRWRRRKKNRMRRKKRWRRESRKLWAVIGQVSMFHIYFTAFDYFLFGLNIIFMGVPVFVKTSGVSKELLFWKSVGSIMLVLLIIFVIFKY